jgi:hypothetical protein
MKMLATAAAGAALFGSVLLLPVATEAQNPSAGVPGFLDPSTGTFTTRSALSPAASGLKRIGTINVTVTAVLGSNIPASVPVSCSVFLDADDTSFDNSASASGVLVRKGSGGTCKVSIPYIFEIAVASTTMNVTATLGAFTSTSPALSYSAEFRFSPFTVPSGTKNLSVTLAM